MLMDELEQVYDTVLKNARKLSMISSLLEEDHMLLVAFQDYVAKIKDLLAFGDQVSGRSTHLNFRMKLTRAAKSLAGCIRQLNTELQSMISSKTPTNNDQRGNIQFQRYIDESVESAKNLKEMIAQCINEMNHDSNNETTSGDDSSRDTRRVSDPLPDNVIQNLGTSTGPLLESAKMRLEKKLSDETIISSESPSSDESLEEQQPVTASIYKAKQYESSTVQLPVVSRRKSISHSRNVSSDRPLSLGDIMNHYNDDSLLAINAVESKKNSPLDEKYSHSWPLIRHETEENNEHSNDEIGDIFSSILDTLTKNLEQCRSLRQNLDDLSPALLNSLQTLEHVYAKQTNELMKRQGQIIQLQEKLKEKGTIIKDLQKNADAHSPPVNLVDKSLSGKLPILSPRDSPSFSYLEKKTLPRPPRDPPVPFEEDYKEVQENDKNAKSVENLLNKIEKTQTDDQGPSSLTVRNSILIDPKRCSVLLPNVGTINDRSKKKDVAATHIQRIFKGYKARKAFKKIKVRKMIAKEIFDTEVSYVKGLLVIYKIYFIPLRFMAVVGTPIIPKEKIDSIFFQIKEIMSLNHNLLSKIEARIQSWNNWQKLGDVFMNYSADFQMYTHYVNNYSSAMAAYNECENNPTFKSFMNDIKAKQEKRALSLSDLLITPVQRVPRYTLLLKELLKNTPKDHPDYGPLEKAVESLQKVGALINEGKRESEKMSALAKIESKISGLGFRLTEPGRVFLFEGELSEYCESGKRKQRHVFLFNDILICTQVVRGRFVSNEKTVYDAKWTLKLADHVIAPIDRKSMDSFSMTEDIIPPFSIGLKGKTDKRVLIASSEEEFEKWMKNFKEAAKIVSKKSRSRKPSGTLTSGGNKFALKISEPRPDLEPKNVMPTEAAIKLIKERMENIENDMRVETKVLSGLQRLNQVYVNANAKAKTKVSDQKQESSKLLSLLQFENSRYSELLKEFESYSSRTKKYLVDRKDFTKVLSALPEEKMFIRLYEITKVSFHNHQLN